MNKLNPTDRVIIDQLYESIKVYVRQFKKTPSREIANLIKGSTKDLTNMMNKFLRTLKKEQKRKIKINGGSHGQ